ncbi:sce7726 family protein [Methylobacterium sp. J-059]|uniref:sce7726 family protein n=1 Tax=Methylobacterium sp. J-059 TaxID=2836643 RepID=UPI001FB8D9E1|nr:sce7726 family protein [Methylobacterium sp. J-059]MCJ2042920.1 sce7726 family protein [Methylobacterium sp. J-059]
MNDRDVRAAVLNWLDEVHAGQNNTLIVQEMGIWSGSVRVDVAVINGELQGFELKSARDTLERLPFQADLYSQVFDRVTLVVAEKHAEKASRIVPEWWGLSIATNSGGTPVMLSLGREAVRNPDLKPIQIARLLWRPEALALLDRHGLSKGFRSKPGDILAGRLAAELPLDILRDEVRAVLKARSGWLRKVVADDRGMPVERDADPGFAVS